MELRDLINRVVVASRLAQHSDAVDPSVVEHPTQYFTIAKALLHDKDADPTCHRLGHEVRGTRLCDHP